MTAKRFIVIDGLDGCGKDTHAARMRQLLESKGQSVAVITHPSPRLFGRLSKKYLLRSGHVARTLATAFFTADVLSSVSRLRRMEADTVIFVRYLMGTAYLPRRLAPYGYRLFRNLLPFPDMAVFIDIEPEVAIARIERRDHKREMFETHEKLVKVRTVAKRLSEKEWVVIDNSRDGEASFEEAARILKDRGFV